MNEDQINDLIKTCGIDTNKISDGFHSFEELYEHRIVLFIALCRILWASGESRNILWRSRIHSDNSVWEGWFICGIGTKKGEQITYHLPESYWEDTHFLPTFVKAPDYDNHTSQDVLNRLKNL